MLPDVELNFQPSISNCLAWSDDGELAVAAGEFVHVLLPRHGRSRQENAKTTSNPWVQIHIRTNVFTGDEWPFQEPLSFNDFSIGEEQSTSTVIALAWSPPGLARNKRCVLAVLTSNLVLSLWASNSDPSVVASWERVLVVNNGIWSSYIHKGMVNATSASADPILRRSLRIRGIAWAPLLQRGREYDQTKITCLSGQYFLAVTTDNNSILFLSVSSPHIDHSIYWDARIVRQHNFANDQRQEPLCRYGSLLSVALETKSFIDRVSWSEWIQFENFAEISIHFRNDNATKAYARFCVSLEFSPRTMLSEASTSPSRESFIHYYVNLDINSQDLSRSTLHKQALQLRAKIDRQNDYGDLTITKFWGLAAHMNYVAICVTFHPGDMVDYLLASEERATILFSLDGTNRLITEDETFPWESDSNTGETAGTQIAILETILDLETQSRLTLGGLSDKIVYAAACASMLLWDPQRVQRLSRVKNVLERLEQRINVDLGSEINVCSQFSVSPDLTMEDVVAILGEATGARSEDDVATAKNIFGVCSICASLVNWQSLSEATCNRGHFFARCAVTFLTIEEPGISKYCEKCNREFVNEHLLQESGQYPELALMAESHRSVPDDYPITEDEIGLEQQNSLFPRFDEQSKEPPDASSDAANSGAPSLASTLFVNFGVCPYCHGKFIG